MPILPGLPGEPDLSFMGKTLSSAAFHGIDPSGLMERRERQEMRERAFDIAKLPENLWGEKVRLEPADRQEVIWGYLSAIQTARRQVWR